MQSEFKRSPDHQIARSGDVELIPYWRMARDQISWRWAGWHVEREGQGPRGGRPFLYCIYHPTTHGLFPVKRINTLRTAAEWIDRNSLEVLGSDFDPDAEWHEYLDDSALQEQA